MANALDDLRSTLMNRYNQPQQPSGQASASAAAMRPEGLAMRLLQGQDGQAALGASRGSNDEPASTTMPQPNISQGLSDAIGGGFMGGMKKPMTGMTAPSWPPTPMPMGPGEIPMGVPNAQVKVPPRVQRFETAQQMQDGYRNNWNPNPMLIRVLEGGYK